MPERLKPHRLLADENTSHRFVSACRRLAPYFPVIHIARRGRWKSPESFRFLIRDRDQKFSDSFDEVFRSIGLEIVRTPFRAPQANGVAERFVRTVRSECLDRLLILNHQHLERVPDVLVEHYNGQRPHRALALAPPYSTRSSSTPPVKAWGDIRVLRRDRLGGVVHEYVAAA